MEKKEEPHRNHYRCNWCLEYTGPRLPRHQKICSPAGTDLLDNYNDVKDNYVVFAANKAVPEGCLPADRMYTASEVCGV
ncbi:hypothetical protein DPMN_094016 [Dreissena polymorpha]|uniref:Uncharacterized protein n=1 Tax=Dreissena polymorpha TaxID=45954 RepID=A0A9D4R1J5_DREPO|nr:hypothetical protein DPMN_094016 [Dreissena polymorpha]